MMEVKQYKIEYRHSCFVCKAGTNGKVDAIHCCIECYNSGRMETWINEHNHTPPKGYTWSRAHRDKVEKGDALAWKTDCEPIRARYSGSIYNVAILGNMYVLKGV